MKKKNHKCLEKCKQKIKHPCGTKTTIKNRYAIDVIFFLVFSYVVHPFIINICVNISLAVVVVVVGGYDYYYIDDGIPILIPNQR